MHSIALLSTIPLLNVSAVKMDQAQVPTRTSQFELVECMSRGTNPGGKFSFNDETYYVKVSNGQDAVAVDQTLSEVLATKLYAMTDLQILENHLIEIDEAETNWDCAGFEGKQYAIASKWVDDIEDLDVPQMKDVPDVRRGLAMDVLVAHYDHVGNLPKKSLNMKRKNGKAFRIDFGGVFNWKASGRNKNDDPKFSIPFTVDPTQEWTKYQTQLHPFLSPRPNGDVFAGMTIDEKIASLQVVASLSNEQIRDAVAEVFPADLPCHVFPEDPHCNRRGELQDMLSSRRDTLERIMFDEQTLKGDLALFCGINVIKLSGGANGAITQRQKWNTLKKHGFVKRFWGNAEPEALTATLDLHKITKQGTLALKIQGMVNEARRNKMSIQELQQKLCQ